MPHPHPERSELSRRTVLSGAAAAAAALTAGPVLVSCGAGSSGVGAGGTVTVKTSQVPVGGGVIEQATEVVVVQPTAGTFKAFSSICPHQGCQVDGISGGVISCPCHGSTFKVSDGSVINGPATQGLTQLSAKVQGAQVVVTS